MDLSKLSGFLLIDKPAGITSFDVIRKLRRQTGIRTFGHAGTLDPFATGLLIIAVNRYTRLLSLLENYDKDYTATMILGETTSTGDPEGEITEKKEITINQETIDAVIEKVLQTKSLKTPKFSAVKVNGKTAYSRARADEDFELPDRPSAVYSFQIVSYEYPILTYQCRVSKGTYIRSLSQQIAEFLGTIAYTRQLCRTAIGSITVDKALQLDDVSKDTAASQVVSVLDILPHMERLTLSEKDISLLRNGNSVENTGQDRLEIIVLNNRNNCLGIAYRKDNKVFPRINL